MTIAKTVIEYDKRVDRGIKWLNKNKPGWLTKINLKKLDLGDINVCVVGQTFKETFGEVVDDDNGKMTDDQAISRGFMETDNSNYDEDSSDNYDLLTAIWFEKIKCMRRN